MELQAVEPTEIIVRKSDYAAMCKFVARILVGDGFDSLNDWDGGDIQELAVACGFLVPTAITDFPCSDDCVCLEYFDKDEAAESLCYRVTDEFRRVQAVVREDENHERNLGFTDSAGGTD